MAIPSGFVGFVFSPDAEDLLGYLRKKAKGEALPCNPIKDCEIYGDDDKEPWKIFGTTSAENFYVFTKLKKKKNAGKNVERRAGCGTWKLQRSEHVKDSQNNHVGFNKLLVFEVKGSGRSNNKTVNGHWLMHEYSLVKDQSDYVLCVIRNKNPTAPTKLEKRGCGERTTEDEYNEDPGLTVEELEILLECEEGNNPTAPIELEKRDRGEGRTVEKTGLEVENIEEVWFTAEELEELEILLGVGETTDNQENITQDSRKRALETEEDQQQQKRLRFSDQDSFMSPISILASEEAFGAAASNLEH